MYLSANMLVCFYSLIFPRGKPCYGKRGQMIGLRGAEGGGGGVEGWIKTQLTGLSGNSLAFAYRLNNIYSFL